MFQSYQATRQALMHGEASCEALVRHYLGAIEAHAALNLFAEVYADEALARAREVDARLQAGTAGPLAGMVVGLKDVICHEGHRVQASSRILEGFVSQYSATAVERLLAADAIVIGRQTCDEFAMGSTNEHAAYGPARNPVDPSRVPGGSSGASAAAVAAGCCLVSLGSDTGGSVRQPASFCGVVGLKPTYSRISRHGLIAYASSFDIIGVLAHNADDAALVLQTIAGPDDFDATVSQQPVPPYAARLQEPLPPCRIGYIAETLESEGLSEPVRQAAWEAIERLRQAGHEVVPVAFDLLDYVLPTYYILTAAEASTNLSRFDGVRYGHRTNAPADLEALYKQTRSEGFGREVQRRIMLGTFVLSASYYDAYFTKAQRVRRLIKERTEAMLQEVDFLFSPTAPTVAMELGKFGEANVLEMYLADLFTVQASVAGIPAISVPAGHDDAGLPIGMQFMARPFDEARLLQLAKSFR